LAGPFSFALDDFARFRGETAEQNTGRMDDSTISSGDIAAGMSSTPAAPASTASPAVASPAPSSTPAPATAAPAQEPTTTVNQTSPEPPKERWPDILDNTRKKTREEVEKEWEPHAWAKQIPREQLTAWAQHADRISRDPIGHIESLIAELSSHATYGPQLRSQAARLLAGARGNRVDATPDLEVTDASGRVIDQAFSAKKMMAIVQQTVSDALGKEVAPLKQEFATRRAAEQARETHAHIEKSADAMLERAKTWHGFTDNMDAVAKVWAAHEEWTLQDAYLDVLHSQILPNLSKAERVKVLADINQKPAASTVSPSSGTTSAPKSDADKDWTELFREKAAALGYTGR
jgi:hypothetical protein